MVCAAAADAMTGFTASLLSNQGSGILGQNWQTQLPEDVNVVRKSAAPGTPELAALRGEGRGGIPLAGAALKSRQRGV